VLDELNGLSQIATAFRRAVIDCTKAATSLTAESFIQAAELAKNVLEVQGAMIFVKSD